MKPAGGQANAVDVEVPVGSIRIDMEHVSWHLPTKQAFKGGAPMSPATMAFGKLLLPVGVMVVD